MPPPKRQKFLLNNTTLGVIALISSMPAWAEHARTVDLSKAQVTFNVPQTIEVRDTKPLLVTIKSVANHPLPNKVRARLGMPDHLHWITFEGASTLDAGHDIEFVGQTCAEGQPATSNAEPVALCIEPHFQSLFPMPGRYRFRLWLEYAENEELKTAVDFEVSEGVPQNIVVVD